MATVEQTRALQTDQRFLLQNATWETYELFLTELSSHSVRLTFDRGSLELMSPSPTHEYFKWALGRLINAIAYEMSMPIRGGGSTTFRREDLERGLEPDECYWIANEPAVRGRLDLNLEFDPPPDLAIEIDITQSSIKRQPIYAALGIPELWQFDGSTLRVYVLQESGEYAPSATSQSFPFLPLSEFVSFLLPDAQMDETTHLRNFIDWLRKLPGGP